jgi:cytochrome c-type biogenesis protein
MSTAVESPVGRREVVMHALAFISGFTLVFVIAGATASAIGEVFNEHRALITTVFGVIVILLGINMLGLFRLPFLAMDKRLRIRKSGVSYVGSVLVGIGFAAGWSPCIGPILAAVLAMASDQKTVYAAMGLLFIYSMGLAIPFFLTAFALDRALPIFKRVKRFLPAIEFVAGLFVIAMGLVLVTNKWLWFTGQIYQNFPALANLGTGPDTAGGAISVGAVFVAGIVSFISPCVLPLVPVYISYLTGQSIEKLAA